MKLPKLLVFLLLIVFLASCSDGKVVGNENFEIEALQAGDATELKITYKPKELFSHDSVLYFSYTEYYLDTIMLYREKALLDDGKFISTRRFKEFPGNIELQVSRINDIMSGDSYLLSKYEFGIDAHPEEELLTISLSDYQRSYDDDIIRSIYEKHKQDEKYGLITNVLYSKFLRRKPELSVDFDLTLMDNQITEVLKSESVSNPDFISLLYLNLAGYNNDDILKLELSDLKGYDFSKNLTSFEYRNLILIYGQPYPTRISRDFSTISLRTHKLMLIDLNRKTNYIFANRILGNLKFIKENSSSIALNVLVDKSFLETLNYLKSLPCENVAHIYYYDILFKFLQMYKEYPNVGIDDIEELVTSFVGCLTTDSWLNEGYTNGYDFGFTYSMKHQLINELIAHGRDSLALAYIEKFVDSDFISNKFTYGAINLIHLRGAELLIKHHQFEKANEYIAFLSETRSPQLEKTIEKYNAAAASLNADTLDKNEIIKKVKKSGRNVNLASIRTNKGEMQISKDKKYLILFFNEDCNACNVGISGIVDGVAAYDKTGDVFETVIVSDAVQSIKQEFPDKTIALEPSALRSELDYYSKSGTLLIENKQITYESPNVRPNTDAFLEYIFNYIKPQ